MSILKDNYYENLDFLSQTIEPWHHPILDYIAEMPDHIVVSEQEINDELHKNTRDNFGSSMIKKILFNKSPVIEKAMNLSWRNDVHMFYDVKEKNFSYSVYEDKVSGSIEFVKNINSKYSDQEQIKLLVVSAIKEITSFSYEDCEIEKHHLRDLAYLFASKDEVDSNYTNRNRKQFYYYVNDSIRKCFLGDSAKVRFRSFNAVKTFGKSLRSYYSLPYDRDLNLANLTLFKMIMDKGHAIYELKEIS